MLNWANQFSIFCFLDSCAYNDENSSFEWTLAVSAEADHSIHDGDSLNGLDEFVRSNKPAVFGHLSYDLKNIIDGNQEPPADSFGFGYFFVPAILIEFKNAKLSITAGNEKIFDTINSFVCDDRPSIISASLQPLQRREDYLTAIKKVKDHIKAGDCYELNYCMKYAGSASQFNVINTYLELTNISPVPFGSLYKKEGVYCICATPERYIKIEGDVIISQPMKGTAKRYPGDELQDDMDKLALYESIKDRTENVMTVDLVRNDLSRICQAGTVNVRELFGIYSFATVHQMVSTIEGKLKKDMGISEILKGSFPMGSMTGAPKKKVMELIDLYETNGRGLFSGSIGYMAANGDADLNVVIRSIFYDSATGKIWSYAGGAITYMSQAELEWEECMTKLTAVQRVLGIN